MFHILMIIAAAVLGPNMADDGVHYYVDSQLDMYRMCLDLDDSAECLEEAESF